MVVFSHYWRSFIHPKGGDCRISEPSTVSSLSQRMKSQRTPESSKSPGSCCHCHIRFFQGCKELLSQDPGRSGNFTLSQSHEVSEGRGHFSMWSVRGHEMGPIFWKDGKTWEKQCKYIMVVLRHFPVQWCMKFGLVSYNKPWKTSKSKLPLGAMIQFDLRILFNWVGSTTNGSVSYFHDPGVNFKVPCSLECFFRMFIGTCQRWIL